MGEQAIDVWDKEYTDNMLQHLYDDSVYAATILYKEGCEKEIGIEFVSEHIGDVDMISSHIDFEAIGEEVLMDYTSVEFRGETYYYQE